MNYQQQRERRQELIELLRLEWRRVQSNAIGPPEIVDVLAEYEDVLSSAIIESFAHYKEGGNEGRKQILRSTGESLRGQFEADYGDSPSVSDEKRSLLSEWIDAWRELALLNAELDKNDREAKTREKLKNRWGTYASPAVRYPDEGETKEDEEPWWDTDFVTGDDGRRRRAHLNQPIPRARSEFESLRDQARARMLKARSSLDTM